MLKVLGACKSTLLEQLDIEFEEDLGDGSLFRSLPTLFPNLTVLTIHRYRSRSSEVVLVVSTSGFLITNHLTDKDGCRHSFQRPFPLCASSVYLDCTSASQTHRPSGSSLHPLHPPKCLIPYQHAADCSARNLAPGVDWVCLLLRHHHINEFRPYRVVRDDNTARAEYDRHARDAGGVPCVSVCLCCT